MKYGHAILIGTSGWSYRSWRGVFFERSIPVARHLEFYASRFPTTELNGVFYRTPTVEAVRAWGERTPDNFVFAWKASKFITHWKRLTEKSQNSLELMETRLRLLGRKAGPVLFQLPPQFRKDRERLASFIRLLRVPRRYVFEFRHLSWYEDDILDLLRDNDIALCLSDHHDAPSPWVITARHVYLRAHGPTGRYRGHYASNALQSWAVRLLDLHLRQHDIYVYFDNDQKSAAPKDALRLTSIVRSIGATRRDQVPEPRSIADVGLSGETAAKESVMPRGDKSSYTSKQKRKAEHIEEGYEKRGVSHKEAERRAWATVNKESGGGKKNGSGRGKPENRSASRKGGRLGARAAARRPAAARSASARKGARTRQRRASR
jgi:uncharacterized protein YecE (DUF72 family)